MEPVWLGVDLGTQGARAVAVDGTGEQLATAAAPLSGHRDGDRHEQDPREWRAAARTVLGTVAGSLTTAQRGAVGGLAVDGTSGTFTLLGGDGEPVTGGLMYDDARAAGYTAAVRDAGAGLWSKLGYTAQPSWALTKLTMLADRQPALLRDTRLAHQPDVVTGMLLGHPPATDSSHAMKTGYDILDLRWPPDVLDALGIPAELLPDVVTPGQSLGELCATAAAETGLPQGLPVFAGMTDGCAAQLSAGALRPGDWNSVLGTTLVLKGVATEPRGDRTGTVYSHRGPEPGTWLPGGASGVGAGIVAELFGGADLGELSARAVRTPPPTCYPLDRTGERFPFVAPHARGFVEDPRSGEPLPLEPSTVDRLGAATTLSAVLHGVAFTERLCFELLADAGIDTGGRIRTTGGGAGNPLWNRLRAGVLGRELETTTGTETAAGMAVLAAWAATGTGTLAGTAAAMVRTGRTYFPGADRHDRQYAAFRAALTDRGWLA